MNDRVAQEPPAKILLVEDDEIEVKGMIRAFRKLNVTNQVFHAYDGVEALQMLRGENGYTRLSQPYILLVDLNMPRMGGIEFIQHVRADENLKKSIVFVFTTSAEMKDVVNAYGFNIAGYFVKADAGEDYRQIVELLQDYCNIVRMPD